MQLIDEFAQEFRTFHFFLFAFFPAVLASARCLTSCCVHVLIAERQKLPLALTTYAIIPITSRSGMLETVSGAFFLSATHNNKSQIDVSFCDASTGHGCMSC